MSRALSPRLAGILRWTGGLLLVAASLLFLILRVRRDWGHLADLDVSIAPLPFATHLLLTAGGLAVLALGWHLLLRAFGSTAPLSASVHSWFVGGLARYVPGKVASLVGRVMLCRRHGVPAALSAVALVVEQALYAILGLVFLAAVALSRSSSLPTPSIAVVLAVALAAGLLLLLQPRIFRRLIVRGLRAAGRGEETAIDHPPVSTLVAAGGVLLAGWTLYGFGGAFLVRAVAPLPWHDLPSVGLAFAAAWAAGFLAALAPAGLGVREATLALLLAAFVARPLDVAVALVSRLTWVAIELLAAALSTLAVRRTAPVAGPEPTRP